MAIMKIAVFAKKRQKTEENGKVREFYIYLSTLIRKSDGETVPIQLKFRESCGAPDPVKCPCFIEFDRAKSNIVWEKYTNEDGDELESAKVWISEWKPAGDYVDHSMDDFDAFNV